MIGAPTSIDGACSASDAAGTGTLERDPIGKRTTYGYDAGNDRTARIDGRGFRTTYAYDGAGQPTGRSYPDGSRTTFSYDAVGNGTMMANATGRYTSVYDAVDRRSRVVDPNGKTITYSYDAADCSLSPVWERARVRGPRQTLVDPDAGRFTSTYDAAGEITTLVNPQAERTTFTYDAAGRRTLRSLGNGARSSWTYDDSDRPTKLYHLKSDGSVISGFDYRYDNTDNRTSVAQPDGARTTWTYDKTYQLTNERRTESNAFSHTHVYPPRRIGNRLVFVKDGVRTTYAYNAANELVYSLDSTGRTTYTFDGAGNQQIEQQPDGTRTTNTWDYENRRTLAQLPSGIRDTATYDPDGLRVRLEDSSGVTNFVWDPETSTVLTETDGSNATKAVYTLEPIYYGRLITQRRSSTTNFYLFNILGTTDRLLDASQSTTDTYLLDGFGLPIASTGSTLNASRFIAEWGYYFDQETLITYVRERYYDPRIVRWFQPDVPRLTGSHVTDSGRHYEDLLLYGYVGNSPTRQLDPAGTALFGCTVGQIRPIKKTVNCKHGGKVSQCTGTATCVAGWVKNYWVEKWTLCVPPCPGECPVPWDPPGPDIQRYGCYCGKEPTPPRPTIPPPIDPVDECCRQHDVCYGMPNKTQQQCNCELCKCLQDAINSDPCHTDMQCRIGYTFVNGWFCPPK